MDMMKLMQQAQQMQAGLQQMQEELAQRTVTGMAGGGMVRVEPTARAPCAR
jgi:DNA-binding protein YbaB